MITGFIVYIIASICALTFNYALMQFMVDRDPDQ